MLLLLILLSCGSIQHVFTSKSALCPKRKKQKFLWETNKKPYQIKKIWRMWHVYLLLTEDVLLYKPKLIILNLRVNPFVHIKSVQYVLFRYWFSLLPFSWNSKHPPTAFQNPCASSSACFDFFCCRRFGLGSIMGFTIMFYLTASIVLNYFVPTYSFLESC